MTISDLYGSFLTILRSQIAGKDIWQLTTIYTAYKVHGKVLENPWDMLKDMLTVDTTTALGHVDMYL